jgi:uncharacterized protein
MLFLLRAGYLAALIISCLIMTIPASVPAAEPCPDAAGNFRNVPWHPLPVTARMEIRGTIIELEVAGTVEERARGLMYRPCLPKNRGMLFPYDPPEKVYYWMKNVLIPLDMIFLSGGKIKTIYKNVPLCRSENCSDYTSSSEIDQVLELNAGLSDELSLKENDVIIIHHLRRQ